MTDDFVAPTEAVETPVEDYGTPIPPIDEGQDKGSRIWLIIVIVLVVLCCCCVVGALLMYFVVGDIMLDVVEDLYFLAPVLLP